MATRALQIVITGDPSSASKSFRQVSRDADRMGRDVEKSGGRIRGFATVTSKGMGRVGVAAGGMAAAGAGAAALLAKSFVSGATDINESLTKNQVLFGSHAAAIDRFSKRTAENFGISRQAALEATGTFGNLFTALEIGPRKSAGMSVALTKLAADMASFNNASPEEALEAIRSGLVGESEPLRRFGVNISDATLRTQALKMGLIDTVKNALTPQQKALATNALLFKQTEKAQGDFARTSGGLANQQRILKARFADAGAELGGKLMPAALAGARALNSLFDESSQGGRVVQRLGDLTRQAGAAIVRAYNDVVAAVKRFAARNREDIQAVVEAVRNYGRFVRNVFEDVVIPIVKRVLPVFRGMVEGIVQVLRGMIRIVTGIVNGDWRRVWEGVKDIPAGAFKAIKSSVKGLVGLIGDALKALVPIALNGAKAIGSAIVRGIVAGVKALPGAIAGAVKGAVGGALDAVGGFITGGGDGDGIGKIVNGLRGGMLPQGGAFGGSLMGARPEMRPFAALGSQFGLQVTSGARPGSITSSGNRSWHSSGEAIDMGGSSAGMMRFAQTLKSRFGGRLAELIYTPMGAGIKNGAPFTYGGQVAADHFDHVHVAFDSGRPGIGDGTGRDKLTAKQKIIAAAAAKYGINPALLWGVYGAESNFGQNKNTSGAGAVGPFQFMPGTAQSLGINPMNFQQAAFGAANYLSQYESRGVAGMLAAYNAGPAGDPNNSETQAYIPKVLRLARSWPGGGGGAGGGTPAAVKRLQRAAWLERHTGNLGFVGGGTMPGPKGLPTRDIHRAGLPASRTFGSPAMFEQAMADADLAIAFAGEDKTQLNKALTTQRQVVRSRIDKIKTALRGRLSTAGRLRLTQELAQLVGTEASITSQSRDINAKPTAAAVAGLGIAEASLTPDLGDDLAAAERMQSLRAGELATARRVGDPEKITDAIEQFRQAADAVKALKEQIEAAKPTMQTLSDLRLAEASLTEDLGDDLSALQDRVQKEQADLEAARASGDPQTIIDAIGELTGAQGALKSLEDQIKASDEAEAKRREEEDAARKAEEESRQRLTDAMEGLKSEMKRQNDIHEKVTRINGTEAIRAFADAISSTQAGSGFRARLASAGSGNGVLIPHD